VEFLIGVQIPINYLSIWVTVLIVVILQSFLGLLDPHLVFNVLLVIESVE
jgi:hypothetical protein